MISGRTLDALLRFAESSLGRSVARALVRTLADDAAPRADEPADANRLASGLDWLERKVAEVDAALGVRIAGLEERLVEIEHLAGIGASAQKKPDGSRNHVTALTTEIPASSDHKPLENGETIWDRLRPEMEAAGLPSPAAVVSPAPGVFGCPDKPATMAEAKAYAQSLMGAGGAAGVVGAEGR